MTTPEIATAQDERRHKPGDIPPADPIIRGWQGASAHAGKSVPQLKRDVKAGHFPAPIEIGPNSLGWRRSWIDQWLASRPRRQYIAAG